MAVVTSGLVAEYVGKLAKLGTGPNDNADATNRATWTPTVGGKNAALTMSGTWDATSGWAGAGSAADPYRLQFDGVNDYGAIALDTYLYDPDVGFTLEVWITHPDAGVESAMILGGQDSGTARQQLWIDYSGAEPWAQFVVINNTSNLYTAGGTTPYVDDGAIHHIVATFDGTTMRCYVDSNVSATTATPTVTHGATTPMIRLSSTGVFKNHGSIITFRAYSDALSDAEVLANYNAGVLAASTDAADVAFTGLTVTRLLNG
jgi:hypothetical protein